MKNLTFLRHLSEVASAVKIQADVKRCSSVQQCCVFYNKRHCGTGCRLLHLLQIVMECRAKRSWKVQHSSAHLGLEPPAPVSSFSPSLLLRWVIVLEAGGSTLQFGGSERTDAVPSSECLKKNHLKDK